MANHSTSLSNHAAARPRPGVADESSSGNLRMFRSVSCGSLRLGSIAQYLQVNIINSIFIKLAMHIRRCRLKRTDQSLIGWAPTLTEPGDTVALCKGAKLPLIIRPKGRDWEFIGDYYVHGVMDGILWEMLEGDTVPRGQLWETYEGKCEACKFWLV